MFPLNWNIPFIKKTGERTTLGAMLGGGSYTLPTASANTKGGIKIGSRLTMNGEVLSADSQVPEYTSAQAGKVLKVADDGSLEWDDAGGAGGPVYIGFDTPSNDIGEDGDFYMKVSYDYEAVSLVPTQSNDDNTFASSAWSTDNGQAWHAFDNNTSTYWSTEQYATSNQYVGFDFGENGAVIASRVGINPRAYSNVVQMHDFKIQASNDNETWTDLYTGTIPNETQYAGVMNYFDFTNTTAYRYYRLLVVNANTSKTVNVFELQFYRIINVPIDIIEDATYKKVSGAWSEIA